MKYSPMSAKELSAYSFPNKRIDKLRDDIVTDIRERNFTDVSKADVSGAQLQQNSSYNYG